MKSYCSIECCWNQSLLLSYCHYCYYYWCYSLNLFSYGCYYCIAIYHYCCYYHYYSYNHYYSYYHFSCKMEFLCKLKVFAIKLSIANLLIIMSTFIIDVIISDGQTDGGWSTIATNVRLQIFYYRSDGKNFPRKQFYFAGLLLLLVRTIVTVIGTIIY